MNIRYPIYEGVYRILTTVAGKFRCAGRNEKRGEHQRAFHVGQGTDGRNRPDV